MPELIWPSAYALTFLTVDLAAPSVERFGLVPRENTSKRERTYQLVGWAVGGGALMLFATSYALGYFCPASAEVCESCCVEQSVFGLCQTIVRQPPWPLLAALVAAPGVLYSWWLRTTHKDADQEHARNLLSHEQVRLGNENIRSNLELAGVQFNQAVALLHSGKNDQSAAGVYSLQRIARFAEEEVPTILEVLAAFVRTSSPMPDPDEPSDDAPIGEAVQAALTVIGALHPVGHPLNLSRVDLHEARLDGDFSGVDFSHSGLWHAHLPGSFVGAKFISARMNNANLRKTQMLNADLSEATLDLADLRGLANLTGADLSSASLKQVKAERAILNGANLYGVNLERADLRSAQLREANLNYAQLLGADLSGARTDKTIFEQARYDAKTKWPSQIFAPPADAGMVKVGEE